MNYQEFIFYIVFNNFRKNNFYYHHYLISIQKIPFIKTLVLYIVINIIDNFMYIYHFFPITRLIQYLFIHKYLIHHIVDFIYQQLECLFI